MMADVMGISPQALARWTRARAAEPAAPPKRGRPAAVPPDARERIRDCYCDHYKQWGPNVLAAWARRTGLGTWSPSTLASLLSDLKDPPEEVPPMIRYEVAASGLMWSEDGAGFREYGRKRELLVAQDEHSRFKVNHRLVDGPANEKDVCAYLEAAFVRHGAPLVLKHDGGAIFHTPAVKTLLAANKVVELTGPPRYPQYNGKKERSVRDIKSFERAMRRHGPSSCTLAHRLAAAVLDLNESRPRPVLRGRTAREVFDQDRVALPDRDAFAREVDRHEAYLRSQAVSRTDQDAARRRAVEEVLLRHGLLVETPDVSTNFEARRWTR